MAIWQEKVPYVAAILKGHRNQESSDHADAQSAQNCNADWKITAQIYEKLF